MYMYVRINIYLCMYMDIFICIYIFAYPRHSAAEAQGQTHVFRV